MRRENGYLLRLMVLFALGITTNIYLLNNSVNAQEKGRGKGKKESVRVVTVPVSLDLNLERSSEEFIAVDLTVLEDGEPQQILNLRGSNNTPLSLAILIQDNLVSSVSNEINGLANFIRHLPRGSRVMVGYMQTGTLQVRQKFTLDLEKAAKALRIPFSNPNMAPFNPYNQVIEALKRFESLPLGRRAVLVVSDGLDTTSGTDSLSTIQSLDLQRAINEAQRRSIAVYSIFAPSTELTRNSLFTTNGQSALKRLSDETGGESFFQGTGAPISFDPFLKELSGLLSKQIALSYLSTHNKKGFHRIEIKHKGGLEINYPPGYTRK
jgi:VWFA-related protein